MVQFIQKEVVLLILNNQSPIYLQIYNHYKNYIKKGVFIFDEKLLSVRELALSLGINPNTVSRAYLMLEEENYIKSIPKKGYYVSYQHQTTKNDELNIQIKLWKKLGINKKILLEKIDDIYEENSDD